MSVQSYIRASNVDEQRLDDHLLQLRIILIFFFLIMHGDHKYIFLLSFLLANIMTKTEPCLNMYFKRSKLRNNSSFLDIWQYFQISNGIVEYS